MKAARPLGLEVQRQATVCQLSNYKRKIWHTRSIDFDTQFGIVAKVDTSVIQLATPVGPVWPGSVVYLHVSLGPKFAVGLISANGSKVRDA